MTSGFSRAAARSHGPFRASPTKRNAGWFRKSKQSASRVNSWSLMTRTRILWPPLRVTLPDLSGPRADSRPVGNDSDVERRAPVFHSLLTLPRVVAVFINTAYEHLIGHGFTPCSPSKSKTINDTTDEHRDS